MRATLLILLSAASYVQASVVVNSVSIQAEVSSSNGYGYYDASTESDWHTFVFQDSKSLTVDAPTSTTQSIATASTPNDLVVPDGYYLLDPQLARANASVALEINRGISLVAQAGRSIAYQGPFVDLGLDASASMTIEIAFQVFNAPVLFSYYEPLQSDWRDGGFPYPDQYELQDTHSGNLLFSTNSTGNPVNEISNFVLQPGEYTFTASLNPRWIPVSDRTFGGGAEGRLTVVPETSSLLLVGMVASIIGLVFRSKRRFRDN